MCTGDILNLFMKYLLFLVLLMIFSIIFLVVDGFMKQNTAHMHMNQSMLQVNEKLKEAQVKTNTNSWFEDTKIDYTGEFSLKETVRWGFL